MQKTLKIGAMKYREIRGNFVVLDNRPLLHFGSICMSPSLRNVDPSEIRTTLACCSQIGPLATFTVYSHSLQIGLTHQTKMS